MQQLRKQSQEQALESMKGEARLGDPNFLTEEAAALNHISHLEDELEMVEEQKEQISDKKRLRAYNQRKQDIKKQIEDAKKEVNLRYRCSNCSKELIQNIAEDKKCPGCRKNSLEVFKRV
ncbi:MAG: hypothetical protein ABEJ83_05700 [Candidatus Nanohaloarchaea archaeon]